MVKNKKIMVYHKFLFRFAVAHTKFKSTIISHQVTKNDKVRRILLVCSQSLVYLYSIILRFNVTLNDKTCLKICVKCNTQTLPI
jgi:hypothetical protein